MVNNSISLIDVTNANDDYDADFDIPELLQNSPYLNESEVFNIMHDKQNVFTILSLNIQSLNAKIDELKIYIEKLNLNNLHFSAICIQETWLKMDSDLSLLQVPGYNLIHKACSCSSHGGVAVYLKDCFNYNVLEATEVSEIYDGIFLKVNTTNTNSGSNKQLVIGNIYRPPRDNLDNYNTFIEQIDNMLSSFQQSNNEVVITGDFNIDLLKIKERQIFHDYFDVIIANGFIPKITYPTRSTETSSTLIDNILVKISENLSPTTAGILSYKISDHQPCLIALDYMQVRHKRSKYVEIKSYTANAIENLKLDLQQTCTSQMFDHIDHADPGACYDLLEEKINGLVNKHLPTKKVKFNKHKHKRTKWITRGILNSIKFRDKLYIRLRKMPIDDPIYPVLKNNLAVYNKILKSNIREAKSIYYENSFLKFKNDIKQTWTVIKDIISKNKKTKDLPEYFVENGVCVTDKNTIANKFNRYFTNIGPELAEKITPPGCDKSFKNYLKKRTACQFEFKQVTVEMVDKIFDKVKSKTSTGIDGLSNKLIKSIKDEILEPVTHIINQSFLTGKFPDKLKLAKIVPIYKKDCENNFDNYRPISLLPSLSKIFERIMHNQLHEYFSSNELYYTSQYGFRSMHSTELATLELIDRNICDMDKNGTPINIYLDLSKAFDTIDHSILLYKLRHYGITDNSLLLLKSYLTNRKQYVQFDDVNSELLVIKTGVPQGSILGPLLFLIYINDIAHLSTKFHPIVYADDTTLTATLNAFKITKSANEINVELEKVTDWLKLNKLSLNINKTKAMLFHTPRKKVNPPKILIQGTEVEFVEEFNFLGIILDKHLSWIPHLQHIAKKISKTIGIMNRLKNVVPSQTLLTIYQSLVMPYLNYGILVWGSKIKDLSKLQKKAVRVITRSKYNAHSQPLLKALKILEVTDLLRLHELKFCYKFEHKTLPAYFQKSCFKKNRDNHEYETRNIDDYQYPKIKHEYAKDCLRFQIPVAYNKCPKSVKEKFQTHSLKGFTEYAKNYYISKYKYECTIQNCPIC